MYLGSFEWTKGCFGSYGDEMGAGEGNLNIFAHANKQYITKLAIKYV